MTSKAVIEAPFEVPGGSYQRTRPVLLASFTRIALWEVIVLAPSFSIINFQKRFGNYKKVTCSKQRSETFGVCCPVCSACD